MGNLSAHPAAELFPLLAGSEYESFKADIRDNGLREPIVLCEGKILDGRNRYRACSELGIEPAFKSYEGESPVAFAWSMNGARRNLTKSQRAAVAADMLPFFEAEARKRSLANLRNSSDTPISADRPTDTKESATAAGEQVGVGKNMVRAAKQIKQSDPALFEQVKNGQVLLADAERKVKNGKEPPAKPKRLPRAEREEQIRALAADGNRADQIAAIIGFTGERGREQVARIANEAGIVLPDAAIGRVHKIDPRRVLETTVDGCEGTAIALDTIWGADWGIEAAEAREWCESLTKSFKALNRLRRELQEIANGN